MKLTAKDLPHTADYAALRRAEYARQGLPMEALTIALIEGDEAEIERIRGLRAEVKARIPKPKTPISKISAGE